MEQKRLFIALGVSFLIIFGWSRIFGPQPKPVPEKPAEKVSQTTAGKTQDQQTSVASAPGAPATSTVAASTPQKPAREARTITIDTPLFSMALSEKGAAVTSMVLKDFRESIETDSPNKQLISKEIKTGNVLTTLTGNTAVDLENAVFTLDSNANNLTVGSEPITVRFQYQANDALGVNKPLWIDKVYTFYPDTYLVDVKVSIINKSDTIFKGSLALGLVQTMDEDAGGIGFEGASGYINYALQQISNDDIQDLNPNSQDQNPLTGKVGWVAIEERYFMTSLIPKGDFNGRMALSRKEAITRNDVVKNIESLAPSEVTVVETQLFMGPKRLSTLKTYKNDLDKAIDYGWFDFLAKPCLWFMNFIYGYIPNYGIAIIILTIVTRAIFWPLAKKSYKSMGEMRKIQPLMQEIREKYKDDKQRMNQEMMTLYRTYKINPLGGCLPMLIQLPVFFALYKMLYSAIELRHAPFFGWINDLSAPDRLFHFGFDVPLMDAPDGIPVLTLIMGASMLLQQKMSPSPGDPAQAKMMMLMPIVFTFIFINFSSGLVLYWLVSNIFSIAQQYYTQKKTA